MVNYTNHIHYYTSIFCTVDINNNHINSSPYNETQEESNSWSLDTHKLLALKKKKMNSYKGVFYKISSKHQKKSYMNNYA